MIHRTNVTLTTSEIATADRTAKRLRLTRSAYIGQLIHDAASRAARAVMAAERKPRGRPRADGE